MADLMKMPDGSEVWTPSRAVVPFSNNKTTDVVLIQTILRSIFTNIDFVDSLSAADRAVVDDVFTRTFAAGRKFADGIYGRDTRAFVFIVERRINSPIKDGIIRPSGDRDAMGRLSGLRGTKVFELNVFWDDAEVTPAGTTKKESGKKNLPPSVFKEIYGNG